MPVHNRLTELNSNPVPSQGTPGVSRAEAGGRRRASDVMIASSTAAVVVSAAERGVRQIYLDNKI